MHHNFFCLTPKKRRIPSSRCAKTGQKFVQSRADSLYDSSAPRSVIKCSPELDHCLCKDMADPHPEACRFAGREQSFICFVPKHSAMTKRKSFQPNCIVCAEFLRNVSFPSTAARLPRRESKHPALKANSAQFYVHTRTPLLKTSVDI